MSSNSLKGFEALAKDYAEVADKFDPDNVADALEDSGIKFARMQGGGYLLDLTVHGLGQMTFRQAMRAGVISLQRNN